MSLASFVLFAFIIYTDIAIKIYIFAIMFYSSD
ncbi:hypothetical protein VISI1226_01710 [Vibrio sinaloensis DSM 21326]|uniref:Uncharacterized protein n=1 Tax=Vibrio sinaloensis DSM 21326 TaxID=945550 RepID=E8M5K8_PHOS4|nr:hypothetical protein VISI1226_01710 [Vibrio sinaloensis DSM 21326]